MNKFIEFLDSYNKKQINYFDLIDILKATDFDFHSNSYIDTKCSTTIDWQKLKNNEKKSSNYEIWQDKYELFEPLKYKSTTYNNDVNVKDIFKEKPLKHIDLNFDSLEDIINILENNPYDDNFKYNFDLQSLSMIKPELIQINNMIGMKNIKTSIINQIIYFIQNLHLENDQSGHSIDYKHTVIFGPPGTGKTEIAEIIGKIYSKIGILKNNVFKKVTRTDLVAGYLGQTALKTTDVINSCLGGCLFIDEAYSLVGPDHIDNYSQECVDTLCEALSRHKNDLMVIIAGYEDELNRTFFKSNKGLESRFIWRFKIDDYSHKELLEILKKKLNDIQWTFDDNFHIDDNWFEQKLNFFTHFGRDIEQLLSNIKISHSKRIFGKDKSFRRKINIDDLKNGFEEYKKHKKKYEKKEIFGLYV